MENANARSLQSTSFVIYLFYDVLCSFYCVRDKRNVVLCALPIDQVDCTSVNWLTKSSSRQSGHSLVSLNSKFNPLKVKSYC